MIIRFAMWFTKGKQPDRFSVLVSDHDLACKHPKRPVELITWDAVDEIRLVTTSDGPCLPDKWLCFVGREEGCSVPWEAEGFDKLLDVIKQRFPGFDYESFIQTGTDDAQTTLWRKSNKQLEDDSMTNAG